MGHSDRTVLDLLHKHLGPDFALSLILSALSWIVCTLLWANLTLCLMSTICSPFSSQLITSNFSSVLIIFHQFFYLNCPSDVYLGFSLMMLRKSNVAYEEARWAVWLYLLHSMYAWQWHHCLLASNTQQEQPRILYTYIHILSFFQFHTARLLAKYRTRQKHQSYTRAKQLLQVNSTDPHITQSTPQPKYNSVFTLHYNILKEI